MEAQKRSKPDLEYNIDHIHGVYIILKNAAKDASFDSVDFWRRAMKAPDYPIQLKDLDEDSLLSLWVHIQKITKKNNTLFMSLFRDFENSQQDKGKDIHEKIRNTLSNYFFPAHKHHEKDEVKTGGKQANKPIAPKSGLLGQPTGIQFQAKPETTAAQPRPSKTALDEAVMIPVDGNPYEFRVHTSARFPKVNLSLLAGCSSGKNLTNSFDVMDREVLSSGAIQSGKAREDKEKGKFLSSLQSIYMKAIPKDLLSKKLNQAQKLSVPPEEKKKSQELAMASVKKELLEMQQKYNKSVEEISDLYTKVSGDLTALRSFLEGGKVVLWTEAEDLVIKGSPTSEAYSKLKSERGEGEILKRKAFLL